MIFYAPANREIKRLSTINDSKLLNILGEIIIIINIKRFVGVK